MQTQTQTLKTWAFNIRPAGLGTVLRIQLQAPNAYTAQEMAKSMYGDKLLTHVACPVR